MIKIRIEGTQEEILQFCKEKLSTIITPKSVSDFYPNRGKTDKGRVYINVD